jgi:probable rRNA maturation factor
MGYKIEVNKKIKEKIAESILIKISEKTLKIIGKKEGEISIAIVGAREIKNLNRHYRNKDKVTDVLSFEYKKIPLVGEVVICLPQVKRQGGKNWKNELIFMLIHGILHLCGYDHEKGEKEAKKMEKLQEEIFEGLKLCSA